MASGISAAMAAASGLRRCDKEAAALRENDAGDENRDSVLEARLGRGSTPMMGWDFQ